MSFLFCSVAHSNYYEDMSPSLVPPQAGRASVTIIPSPELTEVPQSGLAGRHYPLEISTLS